MKITILTSGHQNLKINDFDGNIPWSHLDCYAEFLKNRITGKNVLIGYNTFQMPFFQKLLTETSSYTIIVDREPALSPSQIRLSNLKHALKFAESNKFAELFILGGTQMFEQAIDLVYRVDYFKVDTDPRGQSQFPERFKTDFKKVSTMETRENSEEIVWRCVVEKWFRKEPKIIAA